MSSALAIAAVTAALKDLLNDGLTNHDLSSIGSFAVTALPPDRISTGQVETNQVNLFLYQITPNLGWRNAGLPARDGKGQRIGNPPLALDLHYLLSVYGSQDLHAEVLLGYAMQLLHENPVLTREQLRIVLATPSLVDGSILPGPFGTQSAADLADQIELIKITPVFLGTEDLSKLWTSMQARYRLSMAYLISVVLIQNRAGAQYAPPVLKRGPEDRGPNARADLPGVLERVRPAASALLPAARLGDDLLLSGERLPAAAGLVADCVCAEFAVARELALQPGAVAGTLMVHLPSPIENAASLNDWAVAQYQVSLRAVPAGNVNVSGAATLLLAPTISVTPLNAAAGTINLTITCAPRLRERQHAQVTLLFGSREIAPASIDTPADTSLPSTLEFVVDGVVAGLYLVRLRVGGIDSLPVTVSGSPPQLDVDPQQTVQVS